VLTKGSVLTDNLFMQRIWAWTQCIAIDASVAGTIIRTFRFYQEGEWVKAYLYTFLSALLLFTAAIVSNIEAVQQTLNTMLETAYQHVFIPVEALIWIRSLAIVLLIVAHAMRHIQAQKNSLAGAGSTQKPFIISPELLQELRLLLAQTTISEEHQETPQLTEKTSVTLSQEHDNEEPMTPGNNLLPGVSEEERNKVIQAFKQGIPRREICSYLRWGSSKYSSIVKPVLANCEKHSVTQ
jgi:hypothetical protein